MTSIRNSNHELPAIPADEKRSVDFSSKNRLKKSKTKKFYRPTAALVRRRYFC